MAITRLPNSWAAAAVGVCWLLFVAACCLPAFWLEGQRQPEPAISLLLIGWLGLFEMLDGKFEALGWLANPFFLLATALTLARSYRPALASGAAAFGFALTSFLIREMLINEAGHTRAVLSYGAGFWLWLSAVALSALSPGLLLLTSPRLVVAESAEPIFCDDGVPERA